MHHYGSLKNKDFTILGGFMHSSCQGYVQRSMAVVSYSCNQLHNLIKVQLQIINDC